MDTGQRDQNPLQSMWTAMWPIIMRSLAHELSNKIIQK